MRVGNLGESAGKYLEGRAIVAAAWLRSHGKEPTYASITAQMAVSDEKARRLLDQIEGDSKAREALRKRIERALKTAEKSVGPHIRVPGVPGKVLFDEVYRVEDMGVGVPGFRERPPGRARSWWLKWTGKSWARWIQRGSAAGAILALGASVTLLSSGVSPLIFVIPLELAVLSGAVRRSRRQLREAMSGSVAAVQFFKPSNPQADFRILECDANGVVITSGEYGPVAPADVARELRKRQRGAEPE
jgi:hypothetical protein